MTKGSKYRRPCALVKINSFWGLTKRDYLVLYR